MKKLIIGLAITLILLTATPASAVGFREWEQAQTDINNLQIQYSDNQTQINTLIIRIEQLEQENIALKNNMGILESFLTQLKGLLIQIIQMLTILKK